MIKQILLLLVLCVRYGWCSTLFYDIQNMYKSEGCLTHRQTTPTSTHKDLVAQNRFYFLYAHE